ncbi:ATP-binding protein [Anaeromicrobium sediminis]|uniref:histidine kinase n=1 Tax=Anaeromicrobium sediminis TaxID=1478221 RepID=A0A267MKW1_9FIRM|nr:transporter substrate-binding domain-containing protein [Anaeromicrobium sediminis]PAB59558.1 hypothetical protein CCE28_10115 [Anaeromicrobium sediminis]
MKRKIIYSFFLGVIIILLGINIYLQKELGSSIWKEIFSLNEFTLEEKNWLKENKVIIYGGDKNAPPLRFLDEEDNQYKGIVIDYMRALSIEIEKDIKIKPYVWDKALVALKNKETQICDMFESKERSKHYLFSDPIYNMRGVILTRGNERNIKSYLNLPNKRVAVPRGDYAIEFLKKNTRGITFIYTKDINEAIELILNNKADAVVGDEPVISYFVEKSSRKNMLKILDNHMYENETVLAVNKKDKILLNIINKSIYALRKKGVMVKIQQKWFGISTPIVKDGVFNKIKLFLFIFSIIFLMAIYILCIWNKNLKREVRKQTIEIYNSKKNLQTIFDGLTNFMIVIDEELIIRDVNKSLCQFVHKDKDEIINNELILFKDKLFPYDEEYLKEIINKNENVVMEYEWKNRIYELNTFFLEDNEIRILIMIKDITKGKLSEKKMLQSNKMMAVGQLAAGVAHEIRNPLGVIVNYLYILKKNIKYEEKIERAINVIDESVNRASNIIDNLLNFSRMTNMEIRKIEIKKIIENIIQLEELIMKKNNIKGKIIGKRSYIYINEESIKHILINLISNSIYAMKDGGTIIIDIKTTNEDLIIKCIDTGSGIKKEDLENIFNPFFTTKGPNEGTGLGLYIVYNEVKKNGGDIRVKSKVGEGTTFKVRLPLRGDCNG